eukprot:6766658-Pyramimonas_sp.AAC.1
MCVHTTGNHLFIYLHGKVRRHWVPSLGRGLARDPPPQLDLRDAEVALGAGGEPVEAHTEVCVWPLRGHRPMGAQRLRGDGKVDVVADQLKVRAVARPL